MPTSRQDLLECLSNRLLHLILMPTEACNFRCVYCYEDFQYRRMERPVVEGVKNLIRMRIPELRRLTISWFGGEPLLARDIIREIMADARSLASDRESAVHSDMTTNAYLLNRDVFEEMLVSGVSDYQVSFDGTRAEHDRKRILAGGRGTFDRIWANLCDIRSVPGMFTITVRVHAARDNENDLPTFIDEFARTFGNDERFELFVRPLSRLGGPNDSNLPVFEEEEARQRVTDLRAYASRLGLRQLDLSAGKGICYAARGNSFVVRANGRLNKCTVSLEHPNNQVGFLHPDGTMTLNQPSMLMWMRGLQTGAEAQLQCPMKGYADPERRSAGGVPLTVQAAGRL